MPARSSVPDLASPRTHREGLEMLSPRPHSRPLVSVWEPDPEFQEEPWVGVTSMPWSLQSRNPRKP